MKRPSPLTYNIYRFTPDTQLREQRRFFKLYCVTLLVLGFAALVIWKAEANYREGLKKPVPVNSEQPQGIGEVEVSHYGARITGEKAGQPTLEL